MTMNFSEPLGIASATPKTGTLGFISETAAPSDGLSFGQLMLDMQPGSGQGTPLDLTQLSDLGPMAEQQQGQTLADPAAWGLPGMPGTTEGTLIATTLGPHLNVITPETSAADSQSLEAFARAQGLDEKAVSWLFGASASGTPAPPGVTAAAALQGVLAAATPGTKSDLAAAGLPTAASDAGKPLSAVPGQPQPSGLMSGLALAGAQGLWTWSEASAANDKPTPNQSILAASAEGEPINLMRLPPPAAVWMQRSVMNTLMQDKTAPAKEAAISVTELDLGAAWGSEALDLLSEPGSNHSTGTHGSAYANFAARYDAQAAARAEANGANAAGLADGPDTPSRSETIQNLADKMGQAVGQRILSEMEKGQWHLKLQLRPATLGHIEVEMRMRSGEFDAVFTAPNANTRDLLQDGMAKLRETLSQMGMDVANIHVGGGQTGQNGGDSTPGSSRDKPAATAAVTTEAPPDHTPAPRVKDPQDGLDVLV